MGQFINDDSTSNQSDSSSSTNPIFRQQQLLHGNNYEDMQNLSTRRHRRIIENTVCQCYGSGCMLEARPSSKYCSDKCGLELARNRLLKGET
ncbi:unnamed protein product [Rotaria sp. Silwood2]|nr:unnamed protein product [Rotaria sp. Silwood2]CAF4145391.1 unnamed protein product [Rotaria sp. Silwood2]